MYCLEPVITNLVYSKSKRQTRNHNDLDITISIDFWSGEKLPGFYIVYQLDLLKI